MKPRLAIVLPLLVFAALVAALALAVTRQGAQTGFASHLGEQAPLSDLPALTGGGRVSTADWRGKPYIVNIFASWCAPCRAEHPGLLELAQAHIPVIGIAFKDKRADVEAFLRAEGDPFVLIADDSDGRAGIDWGVTGVPETFLIDAQGVIRFHQAGPLTEDIIAQQLIPLWREVAK